MPDNTHIGDPSEVRELASKLLSIVTDIKNASGNAKRYVDSMQGEVKGGPYERANSIVTEVSISLYNGLDAVADVYKSLNKYAKYLEDIDQ